jgi:hypothetical protein
MMKKRLGGDMPLRCDLIGVTSLFADDAGEALARQPRGQATDVRLRVASRHEDGQRIDRLLREVTALWTGGPAGGGGVRTAKRQRLSSRACLVPRELVPARWQMA